MMKDIKEVKKSKQHKVIVNPELDKYDDMPVFQNKLEIAAAFLEILPHAFGEHDHHAAPIVNETIVPHQHAPLTPESDPAQVLLL